MLASHRIPQSLLAPIVILLGIDLPALGQPLLTIPKLAAGNVEPAAVEPEAFAETAGDRREENAKLLRLAQRKLEEGNPSDGIAAQAVALHQSIDAALAQQEVVDQQTKDLEARRVELENQVSQPSPKAGDAAAYSFVELDRLKDELATEKARAKLVDDKIAAAKAALERAQRAVDESKVKRRQAKEAFDVEKDAPNAAELASAAEQARLAANLAAETLALRKRELAREQLSREVQRLAVQICHEQVVRASPMVVFSAADYDDQLAQIKKKEDSAHRALTRAQNSLHSVNLQLREVQQQLGAETGDKGLLTEQLEAQRWARDKLVEEMDLLTQRLGRLAQLRVAWNRRYQTASADRVTADGSVPSEKLAWSELKEWQKETQTILDELASDLRTQIFRMRDLRSKLTSLTKKADAAKEKSLELLPWIEMQRSQVEAILRVRETYLVTIETSRRVHEKLLEEIGRGVLALTPKTLALGAWHQAEAVWNKELAEIDERSITVGKIIKAVSLFIGGWIVSRVLAALFANRLLKRFRLSKDGTAAMRTLVFYVLLAGVALSALRTVNVPLTAFTILGGALAIGVGFGSQALINNFIGGLIMLAERPVRLGERITFGEYDGVVEDVGFRCTRLRTMTDHLVTIPNSTLVNESIENVARRRTIRRLMNVTITYDTPREKVSAAVQAIRDILEEKEIRERIHPIIGFEELSPRVFFNDYNAESLNILVLYWYAPSDDWWAYVEHSERVNYRIMEEFARLGVEFAFPSRTVYVRHQDNRGPAFEQSPNGNGAKAHAADPYA